MKWILKKMFGTKTQRDVKRLTPLVTRVNEFELQYQELSEEQLRAKTDEFRSRLKAGETVDDLMCEAFAVVKNACRRLVGSSADVCGHDLGWDMVPYDVQIMGAVILHQGKIAEMQTGEGKTLVATMPLYLNALVGTGVHLVTTNDYLARRDSQWMGHVYEYLGLTVGCIQNNMPPNERREQYACDITYGMNSEFGFDYLRDNGMAFRAEDMVQREHSYAIIDETDNILIDEARTPLIISGPAPTSSHQYFELKPKVERLVRRQRDLCNNYIKEAREAMERDDTETAQNRLYQVSHGMPKHKQFMHMLEEPAIRKLSEQVESMMLTDMRKEEARALREELLFTIDERGHDAGLTDQGCEALSPEDPEAYVLPDLITAMAELDGEEDLTDEEKAQRKQAIQATFADRSEMIHNVDQLIRAFCLYEKDVEYVVQGNQVMIVDEFTGRLMAGRRWSDGLHQAVEAKEGVKIERETQTLATITIQNYFRLYGKLAGMTGTAETEADEFHQIYKLDVVVMPTNRPIRRIDNNDLIFKTQREKYAAIVEDVSTRHHKGQPILLGTVSVDSSELLSRMLRRANIPHTVLNAKQHEREAEIVSKAGQRGGVTIATNMAGRGTDIKLGAGVLHIEREILNGQIALTDDYKGESLRDALLENPCGLHVIGSERHEARRIDRQLRGRCARQGDPGSSRFYISLEDNLMRLFGSDKIANLMVKMGLEEGQELEHRWLTRSIETAQRRVEQQNFSIRKRTLEYDDVMNKQREVIYSFRGDIVRSEGVRDHILDIFADVIETTTSGMLSVVNEDALTAYLEWLHTSFPVAVSREEVQAKADDAVAVAEMVFGKVKGAYELKISLEDPDSLHMMERHVLLHAIDTHWQEYLRAMDALRQGVGLRAYGQRDPLVEYKREAFDMFGQLMGEIKNDIVTGVFRSSTNVDRFESFLRALPKQQQIHKDVSLLNASPAAPAPARAGAAPQAPAGARSGPTLAELAGIPEHVMAGPVRAEDKVGRNDACPCGSGKKYKKCCGQ